VKHETVVRSFLKCEIYNALVDTEDHVLFEESKHSGSNSINECIVVKKILGDYMTSRNFILHCHFFSKYL
jgi:hypothetical protein